MPTSTITFIANKEYFQEPSGGGNDIHSDVNALQSLGYKVNLLTINITGILTSKNTKKIVPFKDLGESILFFSGFLSAERLCQIFPIELMKNKKVINIKDVHFFRELRSEILLKKTNHAIVMERELTIYKACDLILCYNDKEMLMLKRLLPKSNIHLHTYFDPAFIINHKFRYNERLVFAGNFNHLPNLDGIEHLISDLSNLIEDKGIELDIYGPGSIEKLKKYTNLPWLKIHGEVKNRQEIYSAGGIFISPLRFGSGIKVKIIEAALSSMPIISTQESIEGLPLQDTKSVIIYKSKPELQNVFKLLSKNQELQRKISESAFKEMKRYSNKRKIKHILKSLLENLNS